jgi:hypothetical protein
MSRAYRYPDSDTPKRGPWYLLTGFILGALLGLVYAWVISPVEYVDTPPASLRDDFKNDYRTMIALAYAADKDLPRARARLALLGDKDSAQALAIQAQQALAEGGSQAEAQALGLLAAALGQAPMLVPVTTRGDGTSQAGQPSLTPAAIKTKDVSGGAAPGLAITTTPEITLPPQVTFTPLPSRTPTATPGAPFVLQSRQFICDPNLKQSLLQIQVFDASGQPVTGVQVVVTWENGQDSFFTGLKPELGLGYADFTMMPEITYTLRLGEGGQPIGDLTPTECQTSRAERYWGSWLLTFNQP